MWEILQNLEYTFNGFTLKHSLEASPDDFAPTVVAYKIFYNDEVASQIDYEFDGINETIKISPKAYLLPAITLDQSFCLLKSGIDLGGGVLDCWWNNKRNWTGFKDCLRLNGLDILKNMGDAAECFV